MSQALQVCYKSLEDMKERCNYQQDEYRRNNLQFVGIEANTNETW